MRLLDLQCDFCGTIFEDVFDDDVFTACLKCHRGKVKKVMIRPPLVDARDPFYVESLGRKFTSHHEMDRYAEANGKTVELVDGRKTSPRTPRTTTVEERIVSGQKKADLTGIISKQRYRLRHGYKDFPNMTTESQLSKES